MERTENSKSVARPGFGQAGRDINLTTNFFRLKYNSRITVYHYDIEIEPECPKFLRRKLIHEFSQKNKANIFKNGLPVYDGNKNIYSSTKLPVGNEPSSIEVVLPEGSDNRERKFVIKIKYAATIDLSCLDQVLNGKGYGDVPQETIVAIDVVIRHFPSLRYVVAGRSIYPPGQGGQHPLGSVLELWKGAYTSARAAQGSLMLNIDESHTAFYQAQPVMDFMAKTLNWREMRSDVSLRDSDKVVMKKHLKMLKVTVRHQNQKRVYRVLDLTDKPASKLSFDVDGRQMSVAQYFQKQYGYQLKYPNLPCLWMSPKEKRTYIPMEVCDIVEGQRCVRKLTSDEVRTMIRATAKKPHLRKQGIDEQFKFLNLDQDPYLKQFNINVERQQVSVRGKVLPAPSVGYAQQQSVQAQNGVWDSRGKRFFNPAPIKNWAVLMFPPQNVCRSNDVKAFCDALIKFGSQSGMQISQPSFVKYLRENEIENVCREILQKSNGQVDLVYCILPRDSGRVYPMIKKVFENQNAVATQCMEMRNLKPVKPQTIGNILQKINTKVGGTNNIAVDITSIPLFKQPVIVFGADNAPPSQGEGNKPAVAALVASMDKFACRYATNISVQDTDGRRMHSPIIEALQEMVKQMLIQFYQRVKTKPQRIIFYRDGVSEGQHYHVMLHEVAAIQKACASLEKDYCPPITFIIAQKRHHTRLFVQNQRDGDRSGNVPAGTVVDNTITSPHLYDFYLNSHAGIQGTNKPAKYTVLKDDNKMPPDMLYRLTYALCHVYARCTRSVSNPAPTYYAKLATERARAHLNSGTWDSENSSSASSEAERKHNVKEILRDISPNDRIKHKMYWI